MSDLRDAAELALTALENTCPNNWTSVKENLRKVLAQPKREWVGLTDEEINKLWAESHEDSIAMQQGFTTQQHYFAHLILRKAQEK
jgi:hypothetical protein